MLTKSRGTFKGQHDESLFPAIRQTQMALSPQFQGTDNGQGILNDRKLLKIAGNREAHKSDVDRAGTEADKLFTCRHVSEFNLHLWSTPAELRNNAGNQVERVKAEPDTELSNFTSRCSPHIIKKLICPSH
jgi:hypothetical protein